MEAMGESIEVCSDLVEKMESSRDRNSPQTMVPRTFYDFFGLHMYFLFSSMSSLESSFKLNSRAGGGKKDGVTEDDTSQQGAIKTMSLAARCMCKHSSKFWKLGVSDEEYVSIPTRVAYQVLENKERPKGMKNHALEVIKATIKGGNNLSTVVAALMDLMHSFEHVAPLVADMCGGMKDTKLAEEMIRDISTVKCDGSKASVTATKNVSGFIPAFARRKPKVARKYVSLLIGLLDREPYQLRNNVVEAIGIVAGGDGEEVEEEGGEVEGMVNDDDDDEEEEKEDGEGKEGERLGRIEGDAMQNASLCDTPPISSLRSSANPLSIVSLRSLLRSSADAPVNSAQSKKTVDSLLDVMTVRAHDTSSFTRTAVLKAWNRLVAKGSLPLDRIHPVTMIAIDRLKDKTVMVRRNAMQLLTGCLEMNPFGVCLDPIPYKKKIEELTKWHQENEPKSHEAAREVAQLQKEIEAKEEAEEGEEVEEAAVERRRQEIERAIAKVEKAEEEEQEDTEENEKKGEERKAKMNALEFAAKAVQFIECLER